MKAGGTGSSDDAGLGGPPPEDDTLLRRVFEARVEARVLGGEPALPRIDRFVLERVLGAGGMGTVWLAHDEALDRRVALKLVRGGGAAAGERMRLREARALARIAHPNVIGVHDVGEHEGRVWLAMEYVPGRTLRECAADFGRTKVLEHWIAAGRGLAAIHAAGLVHRDIKPDNVLLGDDGRVRVIDLGLARTGVTRTPEVAMTMGFVGTRAYAAPEQLRGESFEASADQFAYSVSILECLRAARAPVGGEHEPLPAAIVEVLARARCDDPAQRFASVTELVDALAAAARSLGRSAEAMTDTVEKPSAEDLDVTRTAGAGVLVATSPGGPGDATSMDPASVDLPRGALVGRYVVLGKLGAGGMGVVFAAYDPELDRKVALKLLRPHVGAGADARTRLVREAQALARLNHPHIVAIHDVGEHAGSVWLAMEYVDGETMSAWLKQRRTWREVLAVIVPVAEGLSVAHEAGLVHRDIKPDNIMIGADGRVRIMDLGLARALGENSAPETASPEAPTAARLEVLAMQVTQAGAVLGTPAYMSPEQFRGEHVDARADVFSYCVTLWEALMGELPFAGGTLIDLAANVLSGNVRPVPRDSHARKVPAWLRRVCLQGLATLPERRFPSMKALLAALSQGRVRARTGKWMLGAAAVLMLGASAEGYRRYDLSERVAACEAAGASIYDVWSDEARASVRDGIVATGVSYAPVTADNVMRVLDKQAEEWREQRTRACMADVEKALDAELLDRADWCLDERRMELAALVVELSRADATVVQRGVSAAAGLQPVSPCTDGQVLAALPSPPPADMREKAEVARTTLSQARSLLLAGKYPDGVKQTRSALVEAEPLGWAPMTAAARQLEGELLERTGAYPEAEAASLAAYMEAAKVRAWDVAARAALVLVRTAERQARHADGKVWAGHAEVALLFAGDPLGLGEARRLNNLANIHFNSGAYAEAKVLHERVLAIREKALGPEHPDVATSLNNLALVHRATGAYAEANVLQERALAIWEKALGPEHPDVARLLNNLALIHQDTGAYAEAKMLQERALAIRKKALGPEHPEVASSLDALALIHRATGAYAEAKVLEERALAIREKALGPEHPDVATSLDNLALIHTDTGAYAEATVLHERALAIRGKALGPEHPHVASSLNNLALIHRATGAYAEAKVLQERGLAIWEKALGPEHRDVATSLHNLAIIHRATGAYAEAKVLQERALAIWEKALGPEHPYVATSLDNLALIHKDTGAYSEAKVLHERALAIREKALGPEHPHVAQSLGNLGELALEQNQPAEALPLLERAVAIDDKHEGVQENELSHRFSLAQALVRTKGDRTRALAEARKAADGYRTAGDGKAKELAEVEAFIAEHGGPP